MFSRGDGLWQRAGLNCNLGRRRWLAVDFRRLRKTSCGSALGDRFSFYFDLHLLGGLPLARGVRGSGRTAHMQRGRSFLRSLLSRRLFWQVFVFVGWFAVRQIERGFRRIAQVVRFRREFVAGDAGLSHGPTGANYFGRFAGIAFWLKRLQAQTHCPALPHDGRRSRFVARRNGR